MNRFLFYFVCFFCSFLFSQFGLQSQKKVETVDGVIAVVEKGVILKSDVMQQTYMLAEQKGIDPLKKPAVFNALYESVLDQMVDNLVLYQLSLQDTTILIDVLLVEETLKKEIKKRVEFVGSVSQLEQMFGEPLSMIRAKLRVEIKKALRVERFTSSLYQTFSPSVLDVKLFYNAYKDSLPSLGDRVSFSVFEWPVVLDKNKELLSFSFLSALKDSVALGGDFFELAKRHSDDVGSASSGGRLGFVVRGSLFPEYESVAFGLSVGEVSSPFKTAVGYHIVLLEDRLGEKIKTAHILKRATTSSFDTENSSQDFASFLREKDVYNSVERFDSLCSHFMVEGRSFHGVFNSVSVSSLPSFLEDFSWDSLGFRPFFVNDNNIYLVRVFSFKPSEPVTLKNSYTQLYNMTQNKLVTEKINTLINKASKSFYIQKFY